MLSLRAPYPWIYSLLPPTVFTLLFYVFFLGLFGQFLLALVTFDKKYYQKNGKQCKPNVHTHTHTHTVKSDYQVFYFAVSVRWVI